MDTLMNRLPALMQYFCEFYLKQMRYVSLSETMKQQWDNT